MMWEFRYYEIDAQGGRQRRTATVGSLADYPTESAVRKSPEVQALLLRINSEAVQPRGASSNVWSCARPL